LALVIKEGSELFKRYKGCNYDSLRASDTYEIDGEYDRLRSLDRGGLTASKPAVEPEQPASDLLGGELPEAEEPNLSDEEESDEIEDESDDSDESTEESDEDE
jgi:hypothetical protein